jgi:hypothetical protein
MPLKLYYFVVFASGAILAVLLVRAAFTLSELIKEFVRFGQFNTDIRNELLEDLALMIVPSFALFILYSGDYP